MPVVDPKQLSYEGAHLDEADFVAGADDDSSITSGNVGEVGTAEVGSDGKLSSFEAVRLGDRTDTNDPTRGRLFVDLESGDTDVDDKTEFRIAARDKNSNRRIPVTKWFRLRGANDSDPRKRPTLRPVSRNGKPFFVKSGRVLVFEVKNESVDVTVDLDECTIEIPARLGN